MSCSMLSAAASGHSVWLGRQPRLATGCQWPPAVTMRSALLQVWRPSRMCPTKHLTKPTLTEHTGTAMLWPRREYGASMFRRNSSRQRHGRLVLNFPTTEHYYYCDFNVGRKIGPFSLKLTIRWVQMDCTAIGLAWEWATWESRNGYFN